MRCRVRDVKDCFRYSSKKKRLLEAVVAVLHLRSMSTFICNTCLARFAPHHTGMARYIESLFTEYESYHSPACNCRLSRHEVGGRSDKRFAAVFALFVAHSN